MRVAAVGDVHCKKTSTGAFQALFAGMAAAADVLVLCGDLTDLGLAEEARVLVKELEGLALGVEILSEDERQIVLSEEDIPEIPLDLGISLEREELGEDSAE